MLRRLNYTFFANLTQREKMISSFKYLSEFKCVGSSCKHNCCSANWDIKINDKKLIQYSDDRDYYEKYIDFERKLLKKDNKGSCSALNSDNLCQIQLENGHNSLCNSCAVYPREVYLYDKQIIVKASLSCPEIVENILYRVDQPFSINECDHYFPVNFINEAGQNNPGNLILFKYLHQIIQEFNGSSEELLVILTSLSFRLMFISRDEGIIKFYLENIYNNKLPQVEVSYKDLFGLIFSLLFEINDYNDDFRVMLRKMERFFNFQIKNKGVNVEILFDQNSIKTIKEKINLSQNKIIDDHDIFLNIVKYYSLRKSIFDISGRDDLSNYISELIGKFVMIKLLYISNLEDSGKDDYELINDIIVLVSRYIDHKLHKETFLSNINNHNLISEFKLIGIIQSVSSKNISKIFNDNKEKVLETS